jgi:lipoate synthase
MQKLYTKQDSVTFLMCILACPRPCAYCSLQTINFPKQQEVNVIEPEGNLGHSLWLFKVMPESLPAIVVNARIRNRQLHELGRDSFVSERLE